MERGQPERIPAAPLPSGASRLLHAAPLAQIVAFVAPAGAGARHALRASRGRPHAPTHLLDSVLLI